jgi:5'-methylthioadenosine phosphorylase
MTTGRRLAVIGGSGIYKLDAIKQTGSRDVETPFGRPSAPVMEMEVQGSPFLFLPRHGIGHHISPTEVNYRANIYALKALGADTIVSISAVGSLQEQYAPRDFVLPDQFLDWTKGQRKRTFFDEGMVGHVSAAYPVEKNLQSRIHQACLSSGVKTHLGGTYVCIEGPQFSSRAESQIYRSFGASVIGMTNVPEAYLAKEAGMAYATVAMVTDYDCWKDEHCEVSDIMAIMKDNYVSAQKLVVHLIPSLVKEPVNFTPENKWAVITDPAKLTARHKEIMEVVLR